MLDINEYWTLMSVGHLLMLNINEYWTLLSVGHDECRLLMSVVR